MNKTALICGVGGQDGSYLAKHLLQYNYKVWGTSRDAAGKIFESHKRLGINGEIEYLSVTPEDFKSVMMAVKKSAPDEIYYLASQSSVALSFEQPEETFCSSTLGVLNFLEAIKISGSNTKLYHAGSSECFGEYNGEKFNELSPYNPRSPYGIAKSAACWLVKNYREAHGIFAANGILFNHESPLRPERFVTQKIIASAKRIAAGSPEKLSLGRLDIQRDWGWAPDFVDAMHRILQQPDADDFVIATGVTSSLEDFVDAAFRCFHLDWRNHVVLNNSFLRPTEIMKNVADPSKARNQLGWVAEKTLPAVVQAMIDGIN